MIKEKKVLNLVREILPIIKKKEFKEWQSELEKELVYEFLFSNMYKVEEYFVDSEQKYKLVNTGELANISKYKTIMDFIQQPTGEDKWTVGCGYVTYFLKMKKEWVDNFLKVLDNYLKTYNVSIKQFANIEVKEFKSLFIATTEEFWCSWIEKDFKNIVDSHLDVVWEETKEISMEVDMSMQEEEKRFQLFQNVALSWMEFIQIDKVKQLKVKDITTINKLQEWALDKNYEELELFEEFYPKVNALKNYKWLDKAILNNMLAVKEEIQGSIKSLLTSYGVSVKTTIVSKELKNLYSLRDDIFSLSGDKIVFIYAAEDIHQFYIDRYNRVNNEENGVGELTNLLEDALKEIGSVVVRQIFSPNFNKEQVNIYGAMLFEGKYRGLSSKEIMDVYTIDQSTGEILQTDIHTYFFDWIKGQLK